MTLESPAVSDSTSAPQAASASPAAPLRRTPLHALHVELGARMVPFAGYDMPVHYPAGILAEHKACRERAALFDVSHMGQLLLKGDDAAAALESLVPVDVVGLGLDKQRYGFFTNETGGILDDLMMCRREDGLLVIVNASCKEADTRHLMTHIGHRCRIIPMPDRALLALQGPEAVWALSRLSPGVETMTFMTGRFASVDGIDVYLTRSGYTGEDGFEISVAADQADALARKLLAQPEVVPCGLGARDTLRLEAGLCLYGHDITTATSPVEAALTWAIPKVRRGGGAREGHFPGSAVILAQLERGAPAKRVGLVGLERAPVREGTPIVDAQGHKLGTVTSGTLAPTVNQPIAMAYLPANHAVVGHEVYAEVRGKRLPMRVSAMPFNPHRYHRG